MEDILVIDHLTRSFPDFTLKDITLRIPAGCIMGFIGENGAGKSTTMKLILNMLQKDSGSITVFGQDHVTQELMVKQLTGVVSSEPALPEQFTARRLGSVMSGIYTHWDEEAYFRYLKRFGLKPDMKIKAYSRGMKMKLATVLAVSHHARLLLMDEPTSGLDPIVRDEMLELYQEFIQDESCSILISSHIVSDLEKIADYITFIHKGRILLSEEKDRLMESSHVLRGAEEDFQMIDRGRLIGYRKSTYGAQALLMDRGPDGPGPLPGGLVCDAAGLEDIMLFMVKEGIQ